jgi:hypothetical protein
MYRASLGFPRAIASAAASRADTECLPGNHDATQSVPSRQFPAASDASRVMGTSGMALIAGASGGGPGVHVQHAALWQTSCFAQWPAFPPTVQGSSTLLPQQPLMLHVPHDVEHDGSLSYALARLGQRKDSRAPANPVATCFNALRRGMGIARTRAASSNKLRFNMVHSSSLQVDGRWHMVHGKTH